MSSSSPSSGEIFLVSPQQSSSPKKRRITPSPESSVSKKVLIISPVHQALSTPSSFPRSLASDLFPKDGAIIELQRPLHHSHHSHLEPVGEPTETAPNLPASRQIIFEFDLRKSPSKFFEHSSNRYLLSVFPGAHRVDFDERVLVYYFKTLPPKPWPKQIAGVPCYLTDNENDLGPSIPIRRPGRSRIALSEHLDLRDNEPAVGQVFNLVKDFFAHTSIPITEIQYWGHVVIIVLEAAGDADDILSKVPRSVAQCNCFYLFEEEMCRPRSLSALRKKAASPRADQVDNSQYQILRPGVSLSSGKEDLDKDLERLSSSGVLVKDNLGAQFMTVAAHEFPKSPHGAKVYHPNHAGNKIGEVTMELAHTDIGLVKLDPGVGFINEPFENTIIPTPPFKFAGFSRAASTRFGNNIFLDSSFSGFFEGTRSAQSLLCVPSNDPLEPEGLWIRCQWHYMGQGSHEALVDGVCGSAIWDQNHNVVGFFRYAPASGVFVDYGLSVAADHLLDEGYSMV